jgi:hypothetical protein
MGGPADMRLEGLLQGKVQEEQPVPNPPTIGQLAANGQILFSPCSPKGNLFLNVDHEPISNAW